MFSSMRRRNGLIGLKLIGAPVLRLECLIPRSSRRSARPVTSSQLALDPLPEHHPAHSTLPRERVRSLTRSRLSAWRQLWPHRADDLLKGDAVSNQALLDG